MIVQVEQWQRAVRTAIDMNERDTALLHEKDIDTLELGTLIRSKLTDGIALVESEAPVTLLEGQEFFGDILWRGGGKGSLSLPDSFLRLVAFRMSDWTYAVTSAISDSDPLYLRQQSANKGICGSPSRPVVAIVRRGGGMFLEFYSCADDSATVVEATCRCYPHIDGGDGIDVSERLYRAAVYRVAALVVSVLGGEMTNLLDISKSLMV